MTSPSAFGKSNIVSRRKQLNCYSSKLLILGHYREKERRTKELTNGSKATHHPLAECKLFRLHF